MNKFSEILALRADQMPKIRLWGKKEFPGTWYMPPNSLTCHAFIILTMGKARFYLDNEPIDMQNGDVLLIRKGQVVGSEKPPHDPFECVYMHFETPGEESLISEQDYLKEIEESLLFASQSGRDGVFLSHETGLKKIYLPTLINIGAFYQEATSVTQRAIQEFRSPTYGTETTLSLLLNEYLLLITRSLLSSSGGVTKLTPEPEIPKTVQDAVYFISTDYARDINVQKIAKRLKITPQHLIRLFRRYMYTSPLEYIHKIRMNRAREMLQTTNFSIKEVSDACGFNDQYQFSRLFKKINGCSPRDFRQVGEKEE